MKKKKNMGPEAREQKPGRTIDLPTDLDLVERLRLKAIKYKERLALLEFDHPDLKLIKDPHTVIKDAIMERLFVDGTVDARSLFTGFFDGNPELDPYIFYNAWEVIKDYCTTGGDNITSGPGLPPLPAPPN